MILDMTHRHRRLPFIAIGFVIVLFAGAALRPSAHFAQTAAIEPRYEIVVAKDVMVTMRDGVRLATDVYRPAVNGNPVPGKFPVILERTPYNKSGIEGWARYFVPRGYVAVGQDVRGRYGSPKGPSVRISSKST